MFLRLEKKQVNQIIRTLTLVLFLTMTTLTFAEQTELSASETAQKMKAGDDKALSAKIEKADPGDTVLVPAGIYKQPLLISKPITLKGEGPEKSVFIITADKPAFSLKAPGTEQVVLQDICVQWQLATSDKNEQPFAVSIKDTKVKISNCVFKALGNYRRSPVAVNAIGFTEMTIANCDFTGFDYVICVNNGAVGVVEDSVIRDCGHQGVIVYRGSELRIERNIITGSKYHAVRSTGGKLTMKDNLIANNRNRGVYLGNKSGMGTISNNLIIKNGLGINGISRCRFEVTNNVIISSEHAAVGLIPEACLNIKNNLIMNNPTGIAVYFPKGSESKEFKSKFEANLFCGNTKDTENCETSKNAINVKQVIFKNEKEGDFSIDDPKLKTLGLSDPAIIKKLWLKYKKQANPALK